MDGVYRLPKTRPGDVSSLSSRSGYDDTYNQTIRKSFIFSSGVAYDGCELQDLRYFSLTQVMYGRTKSLSGLFAVTRKSCLVPKFTGSASVVAA